MADPMSAIGALAAASQMAEQCLRITVYLYELRSRIREAQNFINTTAQHVDQLIRISRQIISNPSLQTGVVSEALEGCLKDTQSLYRSLQDLPFSNNDSRMRRFKKSFMTLRKQQLIKVQAENLEKWKTLLSLCISEANSTTLHTLNTSIQVSLGQSDDLTNRSTSDIRMLSNTLSGIITQLAEIDSKLRAQPGAVSSHIRRDLEYIMQNLSVSQRNSITQSHFGSNVLTHYLVPIPRNKTFAGFDNTIAQLSQRYSTGSRSAERVLTLTGVACGGKTQAAIEFCHRAQNGQQFGAIFWVKSSSAKAVEKSFNAISNKLNVTPADTTEARIQTTMSILRAWPCQWLMVFDNYNGDDLSKELGRYMPDSEQGSYLLTRKPEHLTAAEQNAAIYLPELQIQEALELLYNRSAVARNEENFVQGINLVQALGKIPRVIMQVGLYIRKRKIGFGQYYNMLQKLEKKAFGNLCDQWGLSKAQGKLVRSRIESHTSGASQMAAD